MFPLLRRKDGSWVIKEGKRKCSEPYWDFYAALLRYFEYLHKYFQNR